MENNLQTNVLLTLQLFGRWFLERLEEPLYVTSSQLPEHGDHDLGGERAGHKVLLLVLPVLPQVLLQVLPQVLQSEKVQKCRISASCWSLLVTASGGQT